MIYAQLFWSFAKIGLLSIGGGYAAMPLIQSQVVDLHPWLTMSQFADIVTIAEMTPGPIAINAATFVGTRVAGFGGALVATAGCVLPSLAIVLALAAAYARFRELTMVKGILSGLRPAVVAMIASAGLSLIAMAFYGQRAFPADWLDADGASVCIFVAALLLLRVKRMHPILVMALAGAAGLLAGAIL